ncbi:MAG: hypothetical protein IGR93_14805 [Hydrococcus sp. C42_A2020_068]|uniref:hypothetical protein n=1 Tax=Pleurocapsa sp. PCC 7327 TaxID=118163 RepID=UPI00029F9681|nr:hypothetical protein [Pleurocapsa sp. PCC 7327]AFY79758.1 hypothetical protein Ple7327_4668 [Pleurocapsa sp. PCC 7327]MBF2021331.1 hypothetical protein [Hydrococcus sp. C42_A2020_068]
MKIQALDIRVGDRIVAYFNTKMQVCTVQYILDPGQTNITLSVFIGDRYRYAASRIVRFRPDAFVELAN